MKTALLATLAVAGASAAVSTKLREEHDQIAFKNFVKQFEKKYAVEEVFERFAIFRKNLAMIMEHDAKAAGYELGINEFADLTWEEFRETYKGYIHRERPHARSNNLHVPEPNEHHPTELDWVAKGAVTPVKFQGTCGSCWSFSTTGAVEGAHQIATGKLISLSEQELVDCAGSAGNQGCNGGLMDDAFEWIIKNGGLATEASYSYEGSEGTCHKSAKSVVTINGYKDVKMGSESDLKSALQKGPVSVAIEADQTGFQFYKSGVFSAECGKQLDHGVLLVGYGSEDGKDFWKIKNSWGESWGEEGYIRLARGEDQCGLADSASYPIAGEASATY